MTALFALLLWPLQNVLHESAHALVARAYGATITRFAPYPSRTTDGSWTLAHVRWKGGAWTPRRRAVCSIAPQALCTLMLVRLLVSGLEHPVARALMLTCYIDAAFNLGSIYRPGPRETDVWRFCAHSGLPVWVCRVGAAAWHLGFGALVAMALFA